MLYSIQHLKSGVLDR